MPNMSVTAMTFAYRFVISSPPHGCSLLSQSKCRAIVAVEDRQLTKSLIFRVLYSMAHDEALLPSSRFSEILSEILEISGPKMARTMTTQRVGFSGLS
jgi:hypothetical protein